MKFKIKRNKRQRVHPDHSPFDDWKLFYGSFDDLVFVGDIIQIQGSNNFYRVTGTLRDYQERFIYVLDCVMIDFSVEVQDIKSELKAGDYYRTLVSNR